MKVVDYFANNIKNFEHQKSKREIERIEFEPFDWLQLESHLTSYQKNKMLPFLYNHDNDNFTIEGSKQKGIPFSSQADFYNQPIETNLHRLQSKPASFASTKRQPMVNSYRVELTVCFSDAFFMLGYVTFSKKITEVGDKVDFKIKNDIILPEFENIKSWFAKKLKTKKFKVYADIITKNGKVNEVTANSPQISMINEEVIDSIKFQRTIALTKSPRVTKNGKSLFTAEEIFREFETTDIKGNVFNQNEQDILSFLLDKHSTRNKKQLEYLSGSKQAENTRLRFTLHPNFGFLFFIEGKENNHFVWELLNTHATYIWSIVKSENEIELQYKRIEASINMIRDNGREQYKLAYRQNHHDNDFVFCVLEHEDITSNLVDGFEKWKQKLNEKII
jgi:hypothetical protein